MRPKKRILLVEDRAGRLRVTRFVFRVWGYKVISAQREEKAREVLTHTQNQIAEEPDTLDLMIVSATFPARAAVIALAREVQFKLPMLVTTRQRLPFGPLEAEYLRIVGRDMTELRWRMRTLMERRRGPNSVSVYEFMSRRLAA